MSAAVTQTRYTAEEYLTLERSASCKSEFHDGQIYAMTGASRGHNLITVNIARELGTQLKKRPCEAYINDMRVKAAEARSYHYPDIVVVCGTPQFEDAQVDTLLNPTLLIEVLSPPPKLTTEAASSPITVKSPPCANTCWWRKTSRASNAMCGKAMFGYYRKRWGLRPLRRCKA